MGAYPARPQQSGVGDLYQYPASFVGFFCDGVAVEDNADE